MRDEAIIDTVLIFIWNAVKNYLVQTFQFLGRVNCFLTPRASFIHFECILYTKTQHYLVNTDISQSNTNLTRFTNFWIHLYQKTLTSTKYRSISERAWQKMINGGDWCCPRTKNFYQIETTTTFSTIWNDTLHYFKK